MPQCTTTGTPRSWQIAYAGYSARSFAAKPPCTGCTLSATAPRSSWRVNSSSTGKCRCGLMFAANLMRAGILRDERQEILDGLRAGHLRAVLGQHDRDVDALLGQVRVERQRGRPCHRDGRGRAVAASRTTAPTRPTRASARAGSPDGGERRSAGVRQARAANYPASAAPASARSSTRRILPVAVVGYESTKIDPARALVRRQAGAAELDQLVLAHARARRRPRRRQPASRARRRRSRPPRLPARPRRARAIVPRPQPARPTCRWPSTCRSCDPGRRSNPSPSCT